jgi:hypothetical protein
MNLLMNAKDISDLDWRRVECKVVFVDVIA